MKRPWYEVINNPTVEDIGDVEDIAHPLSLQCRFLGRVKQFYSVAQHSVYVSFLVPLEYRLFALFHDATEAFLGDVVTPVKDVIRPLYAPMEDAMMAVIAARFGFTITEEAKRVVKHADLEMLATEARDVSLVGIDRYLSVSPIESPIENFWSPTSARAKFIYRYKEIQYFLSERQTAKNG